MIVLATHYNFFMFLPIRLKVCRSNGFFFFARQNACARNIGRVSEILHALACSIDIGHVICLGLYHLISLVHKTSRSCRSSRLEFFCKLVIPRNVSNSSQKQQWKNLIIPHLLGCAIAVQWITRLITCMKVPQQCIQWQCMIFWKIVRERWICHHTYWKFANSCGKMLKVYKNLSPAITADVFHARQNNYKLRHDSYFVIPNVKPVYHVTESLSNLGPTNIEFSSR